MNVILIQGAVRREIDRLIQNLPEGTWSEHKGCPFYETLAEGARVIISITGVGTIRASIATAVAIQQYHPQFILNQGTAGAHVPWLAPGDIVIGEESVYMNAMVMPQRGPGAGSDALLWEPGMRDNRFRADARLVRALQGVPYGGKLAVGALGSGDLFSREVDRIAWLRARFGELCEDMESAAVYKTCAAFGVPVVGMRSISNNELVGPRDGDEGSREAWEAAHEGAQAFVLHALPTLLAALPCVRYAAYADCGREEVRGYILDRWGDTRMILQGRSVDVAAGEGVAAVMEGKVVGVCSYAVEGSRCEITLLDSLMENRGIGSELVRRVRAIAAARGCKELALITTNDNLRAIGFYQKRGFDLAGIHCDALDASRRLKPGIPLIGEHGIPLRHELEFVMNLTT